MYHSNSIMFIINCNIYSRNLATCISMLLYYQTIMYIRTCTCICTHRYSHCNVEQHTQCAQYTHNYKYMCMCSLSLSSQIHNTRYHMCITCIMCRATIPQTYSDSCPMNVATLYSPNTTLTYSTCSLRPYECSYIVQPQHYTNLQYM